MVVSRPRDVAHAFVRAASPSLATQGFRPLANLSLTTYPNYLPFFNVFAGGPDNDPKYLLDSNLDCIVAIAWLPSRQPMPIPGHSIYVYDLRKNRS